MALFDPVRAYLATLWADRPEGTPLNELLSTADLRDGLDEVLTHFETLLANPSWAVQGQQLSMQKIVSSSEGQTAFAQALPVGYTPKFIIRMRTGFIEESTEWTYSTSTRLFTLINPDPATNFNETFFALCQSTGSVQAAPAPAGPTTGAPQQKLANVAAIVDPLAPNDTFTYTPVATDGTRTKLEKIDGIVYETGTIIPYVANPTF